MVETMPVTLRENCPLGEDGSSYVCLDMPYAQDRFGTVLKKYPDVEPLRYTIYHNPTLDFYWQRQTIDSSFFPDTQNASQSHYTPLSLPSYAHLTEEAILIRQMFNAQNNIKVYDFGMGAGDWLKMMSAYGMQPHGYDICAYSKTVSERYGIEFAKLEDYPDNAFDVISSREVFEHLLDPIPMAKMIGQKLKPGGLCILATPHNKDIHKVLKRLKSGDFATAESFDKNLGDLEPLQHVNHFSPRAMINMAAQAGMVPHRLSLRQLIGSTTGLFSWKQLNRAFYNPIKRYQAKSCLKFFTKP